MKHFLTILFLLFWMVPQNAETEASLHVGAATGGVRQSQLLLLCDYYFSHSDGRVPIESRYETCKTELRESNVRGMRYKADSHSGYVTLNPVAVYLGASDSPLGSLGRFDNQRIYLFHQLLI